MARSIVLLMALALGDWSGETVLPATGTATYYGPGIMEAVAAYRLAAGDVEPCAECVGFVALPRAGDVGRRVWLRLAGGVYGPFLAVDCAAQGDFAEFTGRSHVVEVSYGWAARLGMQGPLPVTVWEWRPPAVAAKVRAE